MAIRAKSEEVASRIIDQIKLSLGNDVMALIEDKNIFEVMANGDGQVFVHTVSEGKKKTDIVMTNDQRLAFLSAIASIDDKVLNEKEPSVDGLLPWNEARINGRIPPVEVRGPSFNIRKRPEKIFTLDDYVSAGRVTPQEKELIRKAIREKQNILVAGGTASGKTTFTNAFLHELYDIAPNDRLFTMEDIPELQVMHEDVVMLQTTDVMNFQDLIKIAMRGSPDRIIIGEVRDRAAHDLLKSWNTGHPGGITTIHADDCYKTLGRLEDLIAESGAVAQQRLIAGAIGTIFYITRIAGFGPALTQIMEVNGYDDVKRDYDVTWIKRSFNEESELEKV